MSARRARTARLGRREAPLRCRVGRVRGAAALAAGALEVSTVDLLSLIYKRAAEALEAFSADPLLTVYKRTSREPGPAYSSNESAASSDSSWTCSLAPSAIR
ncbi:hypothetical protein EXE42_10635 [Halorubrum sp. SP3]|nr:hypothetical protein EXE42_10635 [Halorubrum sp. SP3]TKX70022.1 hypothetical protein EXE45_05830 [Halorubrum sp. SP9]